MLLVDEDIVDLVIDFVFWAIQKHDRAFIDVEKVRGPSACVGLDLVAK